MKPHITRWMSINDSTLEQDFQTAQLNKWRLPILITLTTLVFINLAMSCIDLYYKDIASATNFILFRAGLLVISLGFLLFFYRTKYQKKTIYFLEFFLVIYLLFFWFFLFFRASTGFIEPLMQIVVVFVIYAVTPIPWKRQVVYAILWSVISLYSLYFKLGAEWLLYSIASWHLLVHIMGAFISRNLHFFARSFYLDQLQLSQQLQIEQRLKSQLSDTLDLLTHELRNPLANIEVQARMIASLHHDVETQHLAQKISQSCQTSAEMISAWVDRTWQANPLSSPATEQDMLLTLLQQTSEAVTACYPKFSIHIEYANLPKVCIEPKLLRLVFTNLLENAAKYAPSDKGLRIQFRHKTDRLVIRFRDYGQGMSIDDQLHIFNKHYRVNPNQSSGYGIGLYLVKELLNQCHGQIRVQSRLGYGSAFLVELPIEK
jgi:signal transduction histidine kinase